MPRQVVKLTDRSFRKATAKGVAMVDFWAPWCGPCRRVSPLLEEIAAEGDERVFVAKLNVDDNPKTSGYYRVQSIPTVLILVDGAVRESLVGARSKRDYLAALAKHLPG
ncbi:MAG TPA: thioredoxin [Trueperaceae bacterium]|nr:thioredoxin [Trueperaceae bacterium]